jgi:CheY-like chemotaxis protein
MPVMDGETAFYRIREACTERSIEMPSFLFCTGYDPSQRISKLVEEDPTHALLRKPIGPAELIDALKDLGRW